MRLILVDVDNLLEALQASDWPPAKRPARVVLAFNTVTAKEAGLDRLRRWAASLGEGPIELAMVPRRPQAADRALLRLLEQAPDPRGEGPFDEVDVLSRDRGLLRQAEGLLRRAGRPLPMAGLRFAGPWRRTASAAREGGERLELPADLRALADLVERCSFPRAQVSLGRTSVDGVGRLRALLDGEGPRRPTAGVHEARPDSRHEAWSWLGGPTRPDPIDEHAVVVGGDPRPFSTALPIDWLRSQGHQGLPVHTCAFFRYEAGQLRHLVGFAQQVMDVAALDLLPNSGGPAATVCLTGKPDGTLASLHSEGLWWLSAVDPQGRRAPQDRLKLRCRLLALREELWLDGRLTPLRDGAWTELVVQATPGPVHLRSDVLGHRVLALDGGRALLVGPALEAGRHMARPVQALSPGELAQFFPCEASDLAHLRRLPLLFVPPVRSAPGEASAAVGEA